jgi:simple sugar transport system permease protein
MKTVTSLARQAWAQLALPILAIALSLVAGGIFMILTSPLIPGKTGFDLTLPFTAYAALWNGSLGSETGRVSTLVQAAPLILAALGVGLGFKAGLFNIGAYGQFVLGAIGSVAGAGLVLHAGPWIAIPVALAAGALAGAAWGFIPGVLKAVSGAHEVVTTIMLNFVAFAVLSYLVTGPLRAPGSPLPITVGTADASLPIIFGRDGHLGILIAFAFVPLIWFLLYRTTRGFEIRAVGANPDASRYAGMKPRRIIILTMSLAGMLAGLAGAGNILGINHQMRPSFSSTVGFDAITVALLGRSHPVGVLLASLLFGAMRAGAQQMQISAGVPTELIDVVQAILLVFLVASPLLRRLFRLRNAKTGLGTTDTMAATYGSQTVQ